MCGIFAELTWGAASRRAPVPIETVFRALDHRGPDAHGSTESEGPGWSARLAHTRLKIIDLSDRAAQPMSGEDGRHVLIFNGEIYAFRALRRELAELGYRFTSESDTEVLLAALRAWGAGALGRLDGMFAFALLDRQTGSLLLGRDRLGVKPLYYFAGDDRFVAASELRAVLAGGGLRFRSDEAAVASYVAYGSVSGPRTAAHEVLELPPGHLLRVEGGKATVERYWSPTMATEAQPGTVSLAAAEVRRRLMEAVREQLVSDVPVGVFLSGGMDSGALVGLAAELRGGDVDAFTVGLPGEDSHLDETDGAKAQALHSRVRHHVIRLSQDDALACMDDWFLALDQPSIDGLNTFVVSRAVRGAGVTVALSGVGGDELFGGYAHVRRTPLQLGLQAAARPAHRFLGPRSPAWKLLGGRSGRLDKALALAASVDASDRYAAHRALFVLPAVRSLVDPRYQAAWCDGGNRRLLSAAIGGADGSNSQMVLELQNYLPNTLLRDTDVMSMRNGLEVRVPFLNRALVELVLSLPARWVVQRGRIKPLLADAMGDMVRVQRSKLGFTLPFARWLRGPLRSDVERRLGRLEWAGEYLTVHGARIQWERLLAGDDRAWTRVWAIYVLDRWLEGMSRTRG
ncbi:MAG: asparagine synthase (glutamine-hydrolyzing) [Anaeromyxobacter sp.]|nr:asparagine synthase (glutamine-hydrolyzing) [Anaeromyxobacter sp.]